MAEGEVRYCTTKDGVRIAYCVEGEGSPLIALPTFIESFSVVHYLPEEDAFWEPVAQRHQLIRFDWSGTGLSQRNIERYSIEAACLDIDAVASAAHLRKFALWGRQTSTPAALMYAGTRAPQLSKLVVYAPIRRPTEFMSADII